MLLSFVFNLRGKGAELMNILLINLTLWNYMFNMNNNSCLLLSIYCMPGTDLLLCIHYITASAKGTCEVQQIQFYTHLTYKETESQGSNQSQIIGLRGTARHQSQISLILEPMLSRLCPTMSSSTALEGELWWLVRESTKESRLEWAGITGCAPECPKKNLSYWLAKHGVKTGGKFGDSHYVTRYLVIQENPCHLQIRGLEYLVWRNLPLPIQCSLV